MRPKRPSEFYTSSIMNAVVKHSTLPDSRASADLAGEDLTYSSLCRYKMLVQETWPSYKGIDKDGVGVIISKTGYTSDVKYGRTKLFIRTPRTVFELEKLRAEIVPTLVLFLQRVRHNYLLLKVNGVSSANFESP